MNASAIFWVTFGSALGGLARHLFAEAAGRLWRTDFPFPVLCINVIGSFIIGLAAGMIGPQGKYPGSETLRHFVMIGLCGGFTTFSSFSLQTLLLMRGGAFFLAFSNVALSLLLCLLAVGCGFQMTGKG